MSTDLISLWGAIKRGNTHEIASHLIPPSCTDTARKSYMTSQGQEHAPQAGLGSVEAGPIVRYWTVKFERKGRTHFDHVEACDVIKASMVASKRNDEANAVQVVREIDRDEYEHLTRKSP